MSVLDGKKVVSAQEMRRIEGMAYAQGASERHFMQKAGEAIAEVVSSYIENNRLERVVTLLVGKGNNGGDAYTAGALLIEQGFDVKALHFFSLDACGPLCQEQHERFKKAGGAVHVFRTEAPIEFPQSGVILDGLLGTGFKGKVEGILEQAISEANSSSLPILAIDIPSGVNGNTGEVEGVAIHATATIYLGLPKLGFFIGEGWNHVGQLIYADFGLAEEFIEQAHPEAYLIEEENLASFLPPIKRNRHKYEAGYVLCVAGSLQMPGAAILSAFATLRSGAGITRLFHAPDMPLYGVPLEIITEACDVTDKTRILEESARADSLLIGPGCGRSKETKKLTKSLLAELNLPTVIDADALFVLAEHPTLTLPKVSILTPHRQEMLRLLEMREVEDERAFFTACQKYAEERQITLVLKGAPTVIFHPKTLPLFITNGDPGLATAGTGDVLTGIIAALLAQKSPPRVAAALGCYLHALAGTEAAAINTSYCMTASDLFDTLPLAFQML